MLHKGYSCRRNSWISAGVISCPTHHMFILLIQMARVIKNHQNFYSVGTVKIRTAKSLAVKNLQMPMKSDYSKFDSECQKTKQPKQPPWAFEVVKFPSPSCKKLFKCPKCKARQMPHAQAIILPFNWANNRPAMIIHRWTSTSWYFFSTIWIYHILNKVSQYLWYIYICINKHGEVLPFNYNNASLYRLISLLTTLAFDSILGPFGVHLLKFILDTHPGCLMHYLGLY